MKVFTLRWLGFLVISVSTCGVLIAQALDLPNSGQGRRSEEQSHQQVNGMVAEQKEPMRARGLKFRVVSWSGDVRTLFLGNSEWTPLATNILPVGTLVSVSDGSHIEVALKSGSKEEHEKIRIQSNMVVRLQPDLLKDFRYEQYPIERLFAGAKGETKAVIRKPTLTLEHALQRYLVSLQRSEPIQGRQLDPEVPEVASGQIMEKIDLMIPAQDALFFTEKGRATIPLRWRRLAQVGSYRVYLWDEGASRGQALFETSGDQAQIVVSKRGSYRLQVTDLEGRHRSEIVRISVESPGRLRTGPRKFLPTAFRQPKEGIDLVQPKASAIILRETEIGPVLFSWGDPEALPAEDVYVLTLLPEQGGPLEFRTRQKMASVPVPHGRFYWTVRRIETGSGRVLKASGEGHQIEVRGSTAWSDTIAQTLARKYPTRRVLYIEDLP
jgi:hypothetical protein